MKKSEETINCKECGKECLKYPTRSYNEPRKFCCHKCATDYSRGKINIGEKQHLWKGDKAKYMTKHSWIWRHYGKANKCEYCKRRNLKIYNWANISGKYKREISDYKQLCVSCHRKFDHLNKYGDKCRKGHPRPPENKRKGKNGKWKECIICRRKRDRQRQLKSS